jgi:uncharacterized protein (AIM24 family)
VTAVNTPECAAGRTPESAAARAPRAPRAPWEIRGESLQYLAFTLDPGDSVVLERSAFLSATRGVRISARTTLGGARSWVGLVLGPIRAIAQLIQKRVGGERWWSQVVTAIAEAEVLAQNPLGGQIASIPLDGDEVLIMRRGSWIGQRGDVTLGAAVVGAMVAAVMADAPWLWQRAEGVGDVFVGAHGNVVAYSLGDDDEVVLDPTALLAWHSVARWEQVGVGTVSGTLFAGEGWALLRAVGPGLVVVDTGSAHRRRERSAPSDHAEARRK